MKSKKIWFLSTIVVIALCAVSASVFIQPKAHAQDERAQFGAPRGQECCDLVSGRGQGFANASGAFVVDAEFNLSGGQFSGVFGTRSLQIKSTARLLTNPDAMGNAITLHVLEVKEQSDGDGICESGEDCLVTLDRASLIPTATPGLFDLRSVIAVIDGKGRFAKACGKIDDPNGGGQINFAVNPPTVHWSFSGGRLCKCS